jgi:hypothetical protein
MDPISGIRYPADLAINDQGVDYFKIQILTYERDKSSLIAGAKTTVVGGATILLPMPSNIQDANSVSWGEEKMNNITAAGLNAVDTAMSFSFSNPNGLPAELADKGAAIQKALSDSGIDLGEATQLFRRQLTAEAVNVFGGNVSIDQILARQDGKIFNPNLELLFNGVSLRDFRFSFKMTPRDEGEKNNIIKIIRTLKKYMAASKGGESEKLYLKTPHVFDLAYMQGSGKHPFLHSFKTCALKSVSVNYTGENVYATYGDGTPISIIMELNFQEIVPIYESDYDNGVGTIGVGW